MKASKIRKCENICKKAVCINNKTHHTLLITLPIATYNHYAKAGKRKIKPAIEQSLIDLAELEELYDC